MEQANPSSPKTAIKLVVMMVTVAVVRDKGRYQPEKVVTYKHQPPDVSPDKGLKSNAEILICR